MSESSEDEGNMEALADAIEETKQTQPKSESKKSPKSERKKSAKSKTRAASTRTEKEAEKPQRVLSGGLDMRKLTIEELVKTETEYVKDLEFMIKKYVEPLRKEEEVLPR